jgi:hypothetical protein
MWCGKPAEQQGTQIGADCKEHSRYTEHRRKISAARMKELLQWCQKDAEGIDRAERQAQDASSGKGHSGPRLHANLFPQHVRKFQISSPVLLDPIEETKGLM